jgi:hypothetical protein
MRRCTKLARRATRFQRMSPIAQTENTRSDWCVASERGLPWPAGAGCFQSAMHGENGAHDPGGPPGLSAIPGRSWVREHALAERRSRTVADHTPQAKRPAGRTRMLPRRSRRRYKIGPTKTPIDGPYMTQSDVAPSRAALVMTVLVALVLRVRPDLDAASAVSAALARQ